jgi:hypothetical protein
MPIEKTKEDLNMKIRYEKKNSAEKKQLIAAICGITGETSKYMGPPTMRYAIGEMTIDREGNLVVPDEMDVTGLVEKLKGQGFEGEVERTVSITETVSDAPTGQPLTDTQSSDSFTIYLPKSKLPDEAMERLERILESKGRLIKKALGAKSIRVEIEGDRVNFPWFDRIPEADQVESYTKFIAALAKMAREQSRVCAKEKVNENEKYAFRCFLLRLGFIGDEFKKDRKILLKNFDGSSAFRTQEAADRAKEKLEAKKNQTAEPAEEAATEAVQAVE